MNAKEGRKTFSSFTLIVSFVCLSLVGLGFDSVASCQVVAFSLHAGIVGFFFHAG